MSTIIPQAGNITVILSAELASVADAPNERRHDALRLRLARHLEDGQLYSVQVCEGAYKGTPERSIAITGPVSRTLAIGQACAEQFGQESILAIDHYGHGRLHYTDGDQESIGQYQVISGISPKMAAIDAWTRILATGETFTFI